MAAKNTWYYTIQSAGLRPKIGPMFSAADLIRMANDEAMREGTTLETLAGIGWVENPDGTFGTARTWEDGEELSAAVKKLGDDGRHFEIFNTATATAGYYNRAVDLGIEADLQDEEIEAHAPTPCRKWRLRDE